MKIQFCAIGKSHDPYVEPGVVDFTKRLGNYYPVSWKIISGVKNSGLLTAADLKRKEAESVFKTLEPADYLVVLDERGKAMSSTGLAAFLQQRANESSRQVIFFIGGAYGTDDALLGRADFVWSLSLLTFPHQLVRLILAEQVYRACTISRNEKYHHS